MSTTATSCPATAGAPSPRRSRAWAPAAVLAALAILLGACGASHPSSSSSFAARGDRVCSATRARARAIPAVADTAPAAAQAAYLRRVLPIARGEVSQLLALSAQQSDTTAVRAYLQAQLGQIAVIDRAAAALAAGQADAAGADFQAADALAPRVRKLAQRASLRVCGAEFS